MGLFTKKTISDNNKQKKVDLKSTENIEIKKKEEKKSESMKKLYVEKTKLENIDKKIEKKHGKAYKILVNPLITEKASAMGAENKYIFKVAKNANKIEIAEAIEEVYNIKPVSINIIKMIGKKVRHGRTSGKRKDWKKAIITLRKGENIKIYEGV